MDLAIVHPQWTMALTQVRTMETCTTCGKVVSRPFHIIEGDPYCPGCAVTERDAAMKRTESSDAQTEVLKQIARAVHARNTSAGEIVDAVEAMVRDRNDARTTLRAWVSVTAGYLGLESVGMSGTDAYCAYLDILGHPQDASDSKMRVDPPVVRQPRILSCEEVEQDNINAFIDLVNKTLRGGCTSFTLDQELTMASQSFLKKVTPLLTAAGWRIACDKPSCKHPKVTYRLWPLQVGGSLEQDFEK